MSDPVRDALVASLNESVRTLGFQEPNTGHTVRVVVEMLAHPDMQAIKAVVDAAVAQWRDSPEGTIGILAVAVDALTGEDETVCDYVFPFTDNRRCVLGEGHDGMHHSPALGEEDHAQ